MVTNQTSVATFVDATLVKNHAGGEEGERVDEDRQDADAAEEKLTTSRRTSRYHLQKRQKERRAGITVVAPNMNATMLVTLVTLTAIPACERAFPKRSSKLSFNSAINLVGTTHPTDQTCLGLFSDPTKSN